MSDEMVQVVIRNIEIWFSSENGSDESARFDFLCPMGFER